MCHIHICVTYTIDLPSYYSQYLSIEGHAPLAGIGLYSKKISSGVRIAFANRLEIRKPLLFRHTTPRHGRARRAMTTASMAITLRTRGSCLWAYRAMSVSRFLRICIPSNLVRWYLQGSCNLFGLKLVLSESSLLFKVIISISSSGILKKYFRMNTFVLSKIKWTS